MLERQGGYRRWRLLGHLLPREVRERIFEPAFSDVLYRRLKSPNGRRVPFSLQAFGVFLGCAPIAGLRLFVRRRRLTRLGRVSLWAAGVAGAILLVGVQVIRTYGHY